MNIMNRVTWNTMRKNRVRTIVTIIGIVLSTAMFAAVLTLCTTFYKFMLDTEKAESGSYHIHALNMRGADIKTLRNDERLEYAALTEVMGYAVFEGQSGAKPYLCLLAADDAFLDNMPVDIMEGRLPENSSEVVLSNFITDFAQDPIAVGDTLTLEVGDRMLKSENGSVTGERLYQNSDFLGDMEELVNRETVTLTVVGICERPDFEPFSAPGYTMLTHMDDGMTDDGVYGCYIRIKNPIRNFSAFEKDYYALMTEGYKLHSSLLALEGSSQYANLNQLLISFAVILCLIIFIGSVSLIYSAFSISVSERTRQFGILSSIGATKKQIRRSVLFEAVSLSAIGIPIGLVAGVGGIALTIYLLRANLTSIFVRSQLVMQTHVTWESLLGAALIAFATVIVSAHIPSRRAMRITPMEAIRQTRDVKFKGSSAKPSRLTIKLFGAEGMLAKKYYKRSSRKYRATIFSLAMSVILFITASTFSMYLNQSAGAMGDSGVTFDGRYNAINKDDFYRLRDSLAAPTTDFVGYVNKLDSDESYGHYIFAPDADYTPEFMDWLDAKTYSFQRPEYPLNADIKYIDDASFRNVLKAHGINEDGFFDAENPKALIINHAQDTLYVTKADSQRTWQERIYYEFDFLKSGVKKLLVSKAPEMPDGYYPCGVEWSGGKYGEGELMALFSPMNGMDINEDELPTAKLEFDEIAIGALIEDPVTGGSFGGVNMEIYYPASVFKGESDGFCVYFRAQDVPAAIESMTDIMENAGIVVQEGNFYDMTEFQRENSKTILVINVFSYGFIILIALICVANVFNTISTNVALRRRDYAMLRSMGMTGRGITRMSNYECLIYGFRALLFGLPLSLVISWLIHKAVVGTVNIRFVPPWTAIIIAVISVFAVVFASMLYSTSKLKKDNPIDALKNENT